MIQRPSMFVGPGNGHLMTALQKIVPKIDLPRPGLKTALLNSLQQMNHCLQLRMS
jgi:hypothetical protein